MNVKHYFCVRPIPLERSTNFTEEGGLIYAIFKHELKIHVLVFIILYCIIYPSNEV